MDPILGEIEDNCNGNAEVEPLKCPSDSPLVQRSGQQYISVKCVLSPTMSYISIKLNNLVIIIMFNFVDNHVLYCSNKSKLDPVGSTVRHEVMKLCTGSAV